MVNDMMQLNARFSSLRHMLRITYARTIYYDTLISKVNVICPNIAYKKNSKKENPMPQNETKYEKEIQSFAKRQ